MTEQFNVVDAPLDGNRPSKWDAMVSQLRTLPAGKALSMSCAQDCGRMRNRIYLAAKSRGITVKIRQVGDDLLIWKKDSK